MRCAGHAKSNNIKKGRFYQKSKINKNTNKKAASIMKTFQPDFFYKYAYSREE